MVTRVSPPEVLSELGAPAKRAIANNLPWPYNGMVSDITSAIETGCNYLSALGLACYTEVCGRELLFGGDLNKKDWECFNEFLSYMGAGELLNRKIIFQGESVPFKDAVRNGLVHRYFMKADSSVVAMIPHKEQKEEACRLGFLIREPDSVQMVVVPFFELFCAALIRAKSEGKMV